MLDNAFSRSAGAMSTYRLLLLQQVSEASSGQSPPPPPPACLCRMLQTLSGAGLKEHSISPRTLGLLYHVHDNVTAATYSNSCSSHRAFQLVLSGAA